MRNATKAGFLFASALFFAAPLAAQFNGTWTGKFEERWLCEKRNFTSPGSIQMVLTQVGNRITGSATIKTEIDECVLDPKVFTVRITFGQVTSAKEFTAYFGFPRSSGSHSSGRSQGRFFRSASSRLTLLTTSSTQNSCVEGRVLTAARTY